jgi:hypothetical protein
LGSAAAGENRIRDQPGVRLRPVFARTGAGVIQGMDVSQLRRVAAPLERPGSRQVSSLHASDEHAACRREIQRLRIENAKLAADLSDVRGRCDDLKRSAEMWVQLYERQLDKRSRP